MLFAIVYDIDIWFDNDNNIMNEDDDIRVMADAMLTTSFAAENNHILQLIVL